MKTKLLCSLTVAFALAVARDDGDPASAATPMSFTLTAGALSITAPTLSVALGFRGLFHHRHLNFGTIAWSPSLTSVVASLPGPRRPSPPHSLPVWTGRSGEQRQLRCRNDHGLLNGRGHRRRRERFTGVSTVVTGPAPASAPRVGTPRSPVTVPANFAPGVYTATITQSVA